MGYFALSSSSSSLTTSSDSLFVADLQEGFSACAAPSALCPPPPLPLAMTTRRAIAPENLYRRSGAFLGARPAATAAPRLFSCEGYDDDEPRHFLDSCFRCKKFLSGNCDIYMYRGDTPFCSEECRQEQIEIDEEIESDRKLRLKASSRKDGKANSAAASGSPKSQSRYRLRVTGTVVAG